MKTIYLAGGCLWGVQAFIKTLPGILNTEAGRVNGNSRTLLGEYDGYAECVKTFFDSKKISVEELISYFFEIIDPYIINEQSENKGIKYRNGIYTHNMEDLKMIRNFINSRKDKEHIIVEVLPVFNYIKSAKEHQDRLSNYPNDACHIPKNLLTKYKKSSENS